MKKTDSLIKKVVFNLSFIAIFFLIWWLISIIVNDNYTVPKIENVMQDMLKIFYVELFYSAYFSSLLRAIVGFSISFVLGVVLAIISIKSKIVKNLCSPLVSLVRLVPTMAIASLLCITLSPGIASVMVCFTVVMPYVYSQALSLLLSLDDGLLEMAKVYEIPYKKVVSKIYLPAYKNGFINLLGNSFSFALKITVSSEVVTGVLKSLGGIISQAQNVYLSPSLVMAVTLWTVITGLVVEFVCSLLTIEGGLK